MPSHATIQSDSTDDPTLVDVEWRVAARSRPKRRYALGPVIGAGGMGEVRIARDLRVGREVAVKTIHRAHQHPALVARFIREARIQARLDHPAIVPVFDLDVDEHGAPYFAMKRLTGVSLHDVLIQRDTRGDACGWTRADLLQRFIDVCLALQLAHDRGVVHRDVKPANIVLGDYGEVYVIDWGIARELAGDHDLEVTADGMLLDGGDATRAGEVFGTPGYMAPEQVRGELADPRTDVYALGCVLFELLTSRAALPRDASYVASAPLSPARGCPEAQVPAELDALCMRATEPDRLRRLASTRALADALSQFLDGDRDQRQRQQRAAERMQLARDALHQRSDRPVALREAGRALALDPINPEPLALVAQLLHSPPEIAPPEVARALDHAEIAAGSGHLRIGAAVYASYAVMVFALWAGTHSGWLLALLGALACNAIALGVAAIRERRIGRLIYPALALHCATLVLAGLVLGVFVVVPPLVVGAIGGFLSQPASARLGPTLLAHVGAVIAPFVLELGGLVPRTFHLDAGGLHLHPWAVALSPLALVVVIFAVTLGQLVATAAMTLQLRDAKAHAERALQLQLWHLRQLLPTR